MHLEKGTLSQDYWKSLDEKVLGWVYEDSNSQNDDDGNKHLLSIMIFKIFTHIISHDGGLIMLVKIYF